MGGNGALGAVEPGTAGAVGDNSCAFWAGNAGAQAVWNPRPGIGLLHPGNFCGDGGTFEDLGASGEWGPLGVQQLLGVGGELAPPHPLSLARTPGAGGCS